MSTISLESALNGILRNHLIEGNRPEDGLLHASTDIVGSLRHTMLRIAGAPTKPETTASLVRLETGTLWHERLNRMIDAAWPVFDVTLGEITVGATTAHEVPVNAGLPDGWGGTADTLLPLHSGGYYLLDYKTTKGEGIQYIHRDGAKPEHIHQVSAYYHALVAMGYDMRGVGIWYIPMNEDYKADPPVEPTLQEITPLPKGPLFDMMTDRMLAVQDYLDSLWHDYGRDSLAARGEFITDKLAPPMEREQKLFKKGDQYDVSLVPHWSSMFCPYDDSLCDCGSGGSTKIGHFKGGLYYARKGYEMLTPSVAPKGVFV